MRILVCGGRNYRDYNRVRAVLYGICDKYNLWDGNKFLPENVTIIHGGADGADMLADQWAVVNWTGIGEFKAAWDDIEAPGAVVKTRADGKKYNALAGVWRNQQMLDEGKPDLVVAFPGGSGTADMVRRARHAGVEVMVVEA